jgi:hypothetical protein
MHESFGGVDRQPQATAGNHSQGGMPFLGVVPALQMVQPAVIERATFNGCLADAARSSGLDDHEIADAMHICAGYMSRFMRGVAQQWAKRLVVFMRTTNSLAPLQWLAHQMGCDLTLRDSRAAEVAALQARLRELENNGRCIAA